jgi:hypothetical protein
MPHSFCKYVFIPFALAAFMTLPVSICVGQGIESSTTKSTGVGAAKSAKASLTGVVVDQNNSLISNAAVLAKGSSGGLPKEATTDSDGTFLIKDLTPDVYTISIRHEGFSTSEIRNFVLRGTEKIALKIRLQVGEIGETVAVTAEHISPDNYVAPGISFQPQEIENFPINGRSLQSLILVAPGTIATRTTFSEQGQLSSDGQRANANYFMLDGISANIGVAAGATGTGQSGAGSLPGLSVMGTTNTLLSVDSLQELTVLTSVFAPEFGRTPGAQILLTTRSGTNSFHGSVFEYFRSGVIGARDFFARPQQTSIPSSRVNNFGGVFGGPILRNRTFFFLSYEGLSGRLPQYATSDVPSLAARQVARYGLRAYLNSFPVPNGAIRSNPSLAEFAAGFVNSASFNSVSLRLDQKLRDNLMLFARYSFAPSEIAQRGAGSSLNNTLNLSFETETLTVGTTHAVTPHVVNEMRFNFSRSSGDKTFTLDNFGGAANLDIASILPSFATVGSSFYSFSLGGNTAIHSGKDASSFQDQFNVLDNVSLSLHSHQVKLGIDYRRLTSIYDKWKYREIATLDASLAALQSGNASSVVISTQDRTAIHFTNLSIYAQDTWRASRRLSLTYGLRWEYNPAPSGENEQSLFTVNGLDQPAGLTLAPAGTPLYQSTFYNFAPRVGLAFQISERHGIETVLRGGFGIFYDLGTGPLGNSASSFPYQRRRSYANIYYPLGAAYQVDLPYTQTLPVSLIRVSQPDLQLPRTVKWNVGVEQSLGSSQLVSVSYVGSLGSRLLRTELLANPNPYFEQVFVTTNKATADYSSLQVQFQRRLARGFQAVLSYTWAHSFDIASNDSSANLPSLAGYDASFDRGPSDFDVRQSFSAVLDYEIPKVFKNGIAATVFANWSVQSIISARTAAPVDIYSRRNSTFGPFNLRPDVVAGMPLYVFDAGAPGGRRINPMAFIVPTELRQGSLGRNTVRGFPFSQVDMAVNRRFALFERTTLQFRFEVFNVFNHPNFGDPVGDLNNSEFGLSTSMAARSMTAINSTGFNPLFQAGGPRAVQFSLKLHF